MSREEMMNMLGLTPSDFGIKDTTLDGVKADKIAELKQARDLAELEPINNFDVDEKSLMRINFAIKVLEVKGGTITWTMADNTTQEVSATDLDFVLLLLAGKSDSVHNKYRVLKEQVMACETVEQVNEIEW